VAGALCGLLILQTVQRFDCLYHQQSANRWRSTDQLRIIAENVPTLDHLSSFTLQAQGFPELNLVADIAQTARPITAKIQNFGGVLGVLWDTFNPRQVLQGADDIDGTWTDNRARIPRWKDPRMTPRSPNRT
jgi:hypothetical protein